MQPLATLADLTDRKIDTSDSILAQKMLDAASAAVREAAGNSISLETSTVTLWTEASRRIELPAPPVISVSSVLVDGEPDDDWKLRGSSLWRTTPWQGDWSIPHELTVTYTHGYAEVPADIVNLVCSFAAAGIAAAAGGELGANRGKSYERIDDYQYGLLGGDQEIVDPVEIPERTRLALRRRFGSGGSVVTGGVR